MRNLATRLVPAIADAADQWVGDPWDALLEQHGCGAKLETLIDLLGVDPWDVHARGEVLAESQLAGKARSAPAEYLLHAAAFASHADTGCISRRLKSLHLAVPDDVDKQRVACCWRLLWHGIEELEYVAALTSMERRHEAAYEVRCHGALSREWRSKMFEQFAQPLPAGPSLTVQLAFRQQEDVYWVIVESGDYTAVHEPGDRGRRVSRVALPSVVRFHGKNVSIVATRHVEVATFIAEKVKAICGHQSVELLDVSRKTSPERFSAMVRDMLNRPLNEGTDDELALVGMQFQYERGGVRALVDVTRLDDAPLHRHLAQMGAEGIEERRLFAIETLRFSYRDATPCLHVERAPPDLLLRIGGRKGGTPRRERFTSLIEGRFGVAVATARAGSTKSSAERLTKREFIQEVLREGGGCWNPSEMQKEWLRHWERQGIAQVRRQRGWLCGKAIIAHGDGELHQATCPHLMHVPDHLIAEDGAIERAPFDAGEVTCAANHTGDYDRYTVFDIEERWSVVLLPEGLVKWLEASLFALGPAMFIPGGPPCWYRHSNGSLTSAVRLVFPGECSVDAAHRRSGSEYLLLIGPSPLPSAYDIAENGRAITFAEWFAASARERRALLGEHVSPQEELGEDRVEVPWALRANPARDNISINGRFFSPRGRPSAKVVWWLACRAADTPGTMFTLEEIAQGVGAPPDKLAALATMLNRLAGRFATAAPEGVLRVAGDVALVRRGGQWKLDPNKVDVTRLPPAWSYPWPDQDPTEKRRGSARSKVA